MSIKKIRVMTYNVHSCRGMDGRVDPVRIAKVIEQFEPDLVALQEITVRPGLLNNPDQSLVIAQHLRMHSHFQPAIAIEGGHFGICILSRYPFDIKRSGELPGHFTSKFKTPLINVFFQSRHAIWCSVTLDDKQLYFINTHLGLRPKDRLMQINGLLDETWLGKAQKDNCPIIVCGDLNAGPKSVTCTKMSRCFREVRSHLPGKKMKTFSSVLPVFALDHIFFSEHFEVTSVKVPFNALTRRASDHLPVIADLTF